MRSNIRIKALSHFHAFLYDPFRGSNSYEKLDSKIANCDCFNNLKYNWMIITKNSKFLLGSYWSYRLQMSQLTRPHTHRLEYWFNGFSEKVQHEFCKGEKTIFRKHCRRSLLKVSALAAFKAAGQRANFLRSVLNQAKETSEAWKLPQTLVNAYLYIFAQINILFSCFSWFINEKELRKGLCRIIYFAWKQ